MIAAVPGPGCPTRVMLYAFLGRLDQDIFHPPRVSILSVSVTYLVPRRKQRLYFGRKWTLPELQRGRAAAIHHEVEPSIFSGHGVALAQVIRPEQKIFVCGRKNIW